MSAGEFHLWKFKIMIGSTISHYKILEKLGEGGMGVVYKAQDTKLDRFVALKFLPHFLTSNETERARFLQEAKAASALNHPNVCVIYGIEEFDGQQFIEMEYVDGVTLRNKFSESPLKLNEAIGYAIQIGEALQEAHSKGIVHRDVKSENIMINSKNQVKVMDFGLAKLRGSVKLTKSSSTTGTLAYMAPEQIQGQPVDARADIFSFGVVLYEMLTGHTPFRGEHEAAMMYSIVNEEPQPIQKYRDDISSELLHILNRALEKDPGERYQTVHDMTIDLRRLKKESTRVVRTSVERDLSRSEKTGERTEVRSTNKKLWMTVGAGLLLVCILVFAILFWPKKKSIDSIAVLPLANSASDPNLDYLCDGITESILNNLTRIPNLRVIPRSTMFRFKGQNADPQDVGAKLHVRAVLTGHVVQRGDELSIQLDLIDIDNESQLWGQQYRRNIKDVFALQDDITREISKNLQPGLSNETQKQITKRSTENTDAYQLYLQGRYYWNKRKGAAITKAIEYYQRAIDLDPAYALAYAGLADCYVIQEQYSDVRAVDSYSKGVAAASKALSLDPSLGEAHTTLAFSYARLFEWSKAEKEFKTAIELSPNYPTVYHWFSIMLFYVGRNDEAFAMIKRAYDLDPLSPVIIINMGVASLANRNYDEALKYCAKALELDTLFAPSHVWSAKALVKKGMLKEALVEAEKGAALSPTSENLSQWGNILALSGKKNDAVKIIKELETRYGQGSGSAYRIALVYAGLGESDKVFEWLEKAYQDRSGWLGRLSNEQEWDALRDDPRFVDIMKRIGLAK